MSSKKSKIEWTDRTWNITSGCTKVSDGCKNCYAERLVSTRLRHLPQNQGVVRGDRVGVGHWTGNIRCHEDKLSEPLRVKKPTRYFVCSQSDLFHEGVPFEFIDKAFAIMALCPQHTFMILTKRPERMLAYLNDPMLWVRVNAEIWSMLKPVLKGGGPLILPNVWLGTSVENQDTADKRIPDLLACSAARRFLSCEPLLGPVSLRNWVTGRMPEHMGGGSFGYCLTCGWAKGYPEPHDKGWGSCLNERCPNAHEDKCSGSAKCGIDLVIVGGESGPKARPMHPDWARSLRDQCKEASVAFYFKQWGEFHPRLRNGVWPDGRGDGFETCDHIDGLWVAKGGLHLDGTKELDAVNMKRVGKKAAGHLLDGKEHREFPR